MKQIEVGDTITFIHTDGNTITGTCIYIDEDKSIIEYNYPMDGQPCRAWKPTKDLTLKA
jgi:FKBP-type peptidyl-prolyl cis-trans isomerase 2